VQVHTGALGAGLAAPLTNTAWDAPALPPSHKPQAYAV
jgi:hypothetical protein